ncbi:MULTISPECIES: hypothetical protein [unclassified Sphingomonas]|uniref:hypothetical protein n=1 Tax=unclassified Sphingomonas TaxID=196159 RepID=UPI00226A3BB6|nr:MULTISPECIES: hypothetical protein [unclassified Sphingomonas]
MRTVLTSIGGIAIAAFSINYAQAQAQAQDGDAGSLRETVGYDMPAPVSPSSATSTVSPSSVPQAMERLSRSDTMADLSLGTIYAGGKFGTGSNTTIWSSALGARVRLGDVTLTASLPWMRIESRSTIFTGIDATPVLVAPNTAASKRTAKGFGDLTLGASYTIAPAASPIEIEVSGRAKINTATAASGLSSGKNDYAIGTDISAPLGKVTPFVSFSYRFLGDTAVYDLRDGPAASAGASYALGHDSFLLASYHYSRAATRLVDDAHELFAGASTKIPGSPLRVTGFATAGLSRGAAAASAGLAISAGLGHRDAL